MSQSSSIAAALLIGFIVFVTLRGQLAAYLNLIFSSSVPDATVEVSPGSSGGSSGGLTDILGGLGGIFDGGSGGGSGDTTGGGGPGVGIIFGGGLNLPSLPNITTIQQ